MIRRSGNQFAAATWNIARSGREEVDLTWIGAKADPNVDATARVYDAIDAVAPGGTIWVPYSAGGPFRLVPDATSKIAVALGGKKFTVQGRGGSISVPDGVGDYVALFGAPNLTTDTSGVKFVNLTFDANFAGNPVPSEDNLNAFVGDWRARRNPILSANGEDMLVDGCTFYDSPRQSVMWPGQNPFDVRQSSVINSRFLTTVTRSAASVGNVVNQYDWDTTAIFVRGDEIAILANFLKGLGANYFISRTGIQLSGSGVVAFNRFYAYYRMIIVGNGGYRGVAETVQVKSNYGRYVNGGVELDSVSWDTWTSGPGVRDVSIEDLRVHTRRSQYARELTDGGAPYGFRLRHDSDLPGDNISLVNFNFDNDPTFTAGGSNGVDFAAFPPDDPDDPESGVVKGTWTNITVAHGTVSNAGLVAVAMRPQSASGVTIDQITAVDCARRAGITDPNQSAYRITGRFSGLNIRDVDVVDTSPLGRKISRAVYFDCPQRQVVRLTGGPTGGTFPVTFSAQTATVAYNATAATLQASLEALSSVGAGNVKVTGNAGGPWTVDWQNNLYGTLTLLTSTGGGLTGGTSPGVTISVLDIVRYRPGNFQMADGTVLSRMTLATSTPRPIVESTVTAPAVTVTASKTLAIGDLGTRQRYSSASDGTFTIPPLSQVPWPDGAVIELYQVGTGHAGAAVTAGMPALTAPNGAKTARPGATMRAVHDGSDQWVVSGDTVP